MEFLLLFLVLSLFFTAVAPHQVTSCKKSVAHGSHGIQLTLHNPSDPCSSIALPPVPVSSILENDNLRIQALASRLHTTNPDKPLAVNPNNPASVTSTLRQGSCLGLGSYITKINIGTPSTPHAVIIDTGSSINWLQCRPCSTGSCHQQSTPLFKPATSSSYSPIPCSSPLCDLSYSSTLNPSQCSSDGICVYRSSYGDASFSVGLLGKDTLRFGYNNSLVLKSFIHGCGHENKGIFGKSAGMIGLAMHKLSFLSQVAGKVGANAFSYCLPTSKSTGHLSLGRYNASKFSFTPMITVPQDRTLYFLRLEGITVRGQTLRVPNSAYDTPTVLDSGTVISRLPPLVHNALSAAVAAGAEAMGLKRANAYKRLSTCFVGKAEKMRLPEVALLFKGGATLKLRRPNLMIDVSKNVTCLAFLPAETVVVIGSRQQQTFTVVYDVDGKRVGFAAGGCE